MRSIIGLAALLLFFSSCNNKAKDQVVKDPGIDAQEKTMKDAIDKFPDSLLLKENLAQYYRDNGSYDMAIAMINNALKKDSNMARLWDIKATLHLEDDDTLNAIRAFEKAISIYPDPTDMISVGALYAQTKDPKALALADALLANSKARAGKEALFIKGLYYSYAGDKKKAIAFFDNCLAMDYTFMFAYREKAIALYDSGKYEEALAVLDKAVTLQNSFDEGYYWMGRCFEKLNRNSAAIESYRTALQYDPNFAEAKEALARLGVK